MYHDEIFFSKLKMSSLSNNAKKRVCSASDYNESNYPLKTALAEIKELEIEVKEQAYEIMLYKADIRQYKCKIEKIQRISLGAVARVDALLEIGNARIEDGIINDDEIMSDSEDHHYRNTCTYLNH